MSFRESISVCMRKFADFNGRARRSEFWWFYLFLQLVAVVTIGIPYVIFAVALIAETSQSSGSSFEFTDGMMFGIVLVLVGVLIQFVFTLPYLAAAARRLHDTGQSGHWLWFNVLGLGIIPFVMCIMDGQPHPNRWGPDPKAAERWNSPVQPYPHTPPPPTQWSGQAPQPGGYAQPGGYSQPPAPPVAPPAPGGQPHNPAPEDPFRTPPTQ